MLIRNDKKALGQFEKAGLVSFRLQMSGDKTDLGERETNADAVAVFTLLA